MELYIIEFYLSFVFKHKNPPNHNKDDESYPCGSHTHSHILPNMDKLQQKLDLDNLDSNS